MAGNSFDEAIGRYVRRRHGVVIGQKITPIAKAGLYVPGGTAAYPSSVLMNAIPAKIAGVKEIIMVTPPLKDGTPNKDILVAASICGVDRVFLAGGAQAVAALAYGTETIPKVDKIVGPGNIFVATAYKLLYGTVDIVFHDRLKAFQIWSRTAKDDDISSIIPDGVRFVCGYYNGGSPIEITVEVFGYVKGIATHYNVPVNGWKRMTYNGELIKFVNSNCVFKLL